MANCNNTLGAFRLIIFATTFVLLSCQATGCSATAYHKVLEKLDKFASGRLETSSYVTREELFDMVDEYNNYSPAIKDAVKRGTPTNRLMLHLVIIPTIRFRLILEQKPQLFENFRKRVENGFKRFKPAYFGELIDGGSIYIKHKKLITLIEKIQSDVSSLTLKDFEEARDQGKAWRDRLLELVETEDIFAHDRELASILNVMNGFLYKPLFEFILPEVTPRSNPQELAKLYFEIMWSKYQIKLVNGQWTRYVTS